MLSIKTWNSVLQNVGENMMDYKKLEDMLKGKTDKELREIVKRTKIAKRISKKQIDKIWRRVWQLKNAHRNLDVVQKKAQLVRGTAKGKDCPALRELKSNYGSFYYFECGARDTWTQRRRKEEIFRDFCHSCRLTRNDYEKAKVKCTWKGVFEQQ